ncbi:MAG: ParB/RepB/Spo0J family partition protein [Clostridia bacterium]|nr:ParB/RepB/Spo0J family partition protein [Clostridia bacterium]
MALGQGLDAFFSSDNVNTDEKTSVDTVKELKISEVEPRRDQPRKHFDQEQLQLLANSIAQHGVIQPIIVTEGEGGIYRIIAGERRWRASRMAGLSTIPAVVRSYDALMQAEVALIENLQREDLNPIEEALGYQSLMEQFGLTQEKVSDKVGKSRSAVANTLRLLALDKEIQEMLVEGEISSGHGRALLAVEDSKKRLEMAKAAANDKLSVREMEDLARETKKKPGRGANKRHYVDVEKELKNIFGTRVKITGETKGKIELYYYTEEDLIRLIDIIQNL